MKTSIIDPWKIDGDNTKFNDEVINNFEDSFVVTEQDESLKLSDSDQYLARLYTRLKHVKGGTSKKDLVNSLSQVKEDSVARFISSGERLETEEEVLITGNPLIRHITPHLQAMTACELVHLLKADVLQVMTDVQNEQQIEEKLETSQNSSCDDH